MGATLWVLPWRGVQVTWEECWWEASDWAGLKELGATKTGTSASGGGHYWAAVWLLCGCVFGARWERVGAGLGVGAGATMRLPP